MKSYKCKECDNDCMKVNFRGDCDKCEYNGFYVDHELVESLGYDVADDGVYYYDMTLKAKAESELGYEIERCEVYESGNCGLGTEMAGGDGCWQYVCCKCNKTVESIPVMTC